ncbi:MAG TPA: hypothetical protein VEW95_13710 [Candidatus Limnocylindrales bacterium]|nr:hypothetical protein [Candidatus Limnocylindrales bacterium]
MSIRLDPRRVNALKHLAGEAGVRPGDLVRQWVEERIDASRPGAEVAPSAPGAESLLSRFEALVARVAALESADSPTTPRTDDAAGTAAAAQPKIDEPKRQGSPKRASAAPSGERVALHDEMIAVIRERGPMRAAELAAAIVERGRYAVPRSGKPIDAKTVSQRVSNPTYRSRFVRDEGRIGLADEAPAETDEAPADI